MKNPLGTPTTYGDRYDPNLLFRIAREEARRELPGTYPPFRGYDVWNMYELSWLGAAGVPEVAIGRLVVPASSPYLVESKSLKLYLNSFNNTVFENADVVRDTIRNDLSKLLESREIELTIAPPSAWRTHARFEELPGRCIDDLVPGHETLLFGAGEERMVRESLHSHLFRSLCPVTGQPDWGSISISYEGARIDGGALLGLIISLREHRGFHEDCCERLYARVWEECRPVRLAVGCFFTRRGGIDINPVRFSEGADDAVSYARGVRQ